MKIIFLDIDGVLNGDDNENPGFAQGWPYSHLEDVLVARVERLAKETQAKIVVSSSWRVRFNLDEFREMFSVKGLTAEVIDVTPHVFPRRFSQRVSRGLEVTAWLEENPDVTNYVILDDIHDFEGMESNFVKTFYKVGITEEDVEQAIKILNSSKE